MKNPAFVSNRNACKLCAPLGACLALRGIEGCIPLIHGSQGCSTYIRRYGISHFREPIDIASSNFTESAAIFGGMENLFTALDNVSRSYKPQAIGVTSTCLSETMGEDLGRYLRQYETERAAGRRNAGDLSPAVFYAATPSYRGTHMDGFHEAIRAAVSAIAGEGAEAKNPAGETRLNLISGFVSAEDIRELHGILDAFGMPYTLLPDYSESLDGGTWETYQKLPQGGTQIEDIKKMNAAAGTLYLGKAVSPDQNAGLWLEKNHGIPLNQIDLPIGVKNTDLFFETLARISGREIPEEFVKQRNRVIDAYIDGHKYCNGKRVILYGEEDFVVALASFLDEIGMVPVIAATGAPDAGKAPAGFRERMTRALVNVRREIEILEDADFVTILEKARRLECDLVMGHSKGLYLSRELGVPLARCGFPIHDRIGGQRILHLGYRGTLHLFDLLCNTLLQAKQDQVSKGYTYM
ncbi:MAG: nitrogenase [Treponema sp.]|jgi:nitrogenase molybdenum-iron protein NifN|nr:nitrogenase [Treponema sp.]